MTATDHVSGLVTYRLLLAYCKHCECMIAVLVFQCLNGQAPPYLAYDCHASDVRLCQLCSVDSVTHTPTVIGACSYRAAGVPAELRQCVSLGQFKRRLKTQLFGLYDHCAL